MTTIDDFQNGERPEQVEQPRVRKVSTVRNPNNNRERIGTTVIVLNRGDDDEEVRGYLSTRTKEDNLFRKFDSYPITEDVLYRLAREEVSRIIIVADEAGETTAYEFTVAQYRESSNRYVWTRRVDGETVEDAQLCPPRSDAVHTWDITDLRDLFTA